MFRALEIAASGMAGQQTAMDTVADNLSNADTTGFKASKVRFEELLSVEDQGGESWAQGVRVASSDRDSTQGVIQNTGATWDLAINGPGYFPLTDAGGKEVYTRAGNFHVDSEGRVVHKSGLILAGGITVPQGSQTIQIGADGTVEATPPGATQPVVLGRVELAGFADEAGLSSRGQGLFDPTDASGPALRQDASTTALGLGNIQQGALEGSNVNKVQEMVDLINTQRAYETGAKVISAADDMLGYANNLRR